MKIKHRTETKEWSPIYNIIATKKVLQYKKGEKILIGLDSMQFSFFMGMNGYPFGYCGSSGGAKFVLPKEVMDNIAVEKEFTTVNTIIEIHPLKNFTGPIVTSH